MADFNIFGTAPESLAGLLGEQATKDLQRKAMTTGLINTALGYLVQPKNQNLGLGRILGQSLMSGMTGAQGVYTGALEDWQTKQKIEEIQRQKAQREAFDTAAKSLYTTTPAQYATEQISGGGYMPSTNQVAGGTAPNFNVSSQYSQPTTQQVMTAPATQSLNENALTSMMLSGDNRANTYLTGLKTLKEITTKAPRETITVGNVVLDKETMKPVYTGEKELKALPTRERQVGRYKIQEEMQPDGTWKGFGGGSMDAPTKPAEISYSVQTDKNGRAVYVPNKPGISAIDVNTNKPVTYEPKFEEKALTVDQAKAGNFYNRMIPISKKLNTPMIDNSTKQPLLNDDGTQMTLEDYVGNPSVFAQATRAIPSFGLTSKIAGASIGNFRQQAETLKKNWLTANLRKESGAVIGVEEMQTEDEKYFPQINDSFETRQLKKQLRRQAEEGMLLESGKSGKTMPNSNNVLNKADAIIAGVK